MARHFLLSVHSPTSTAQAGLAAFSLLFCAFALFLCASHSRKWRRHWSACYNWVNEDPIIELNTETVFYTTGEESICHREEEQEVSVWQKNILMGGKCQLPDFSGVIVYDSAGNIVSQTKASHKIYP